MNRKIRNAKPAVITVIMVFVLFTTSTASFSQPNLIDEESLRVIKAELKKELRAEIKQELYAEFLTDIELLVEENVRKEIQAYLTALQNTPEWQKQANAGETNPSGEPGGESLDSAVRRSVREILHSHGIKRYISDEELDMIVAGRGIEPQLTIAQGYKKNPEPSPSLQAKKYTHPAPLDENDYNFAAGDEKISDSIERTLQQKGSVLLPKGTFQIEPSTTWAHFSSNSINIQGFSILPVLVIGDISVRRTKRDVLIQNFTLKYGLWNNLQTEVKIPFRAQYNRDTISESSESTKSSAGMGDIEFGLSRQIGWEHGLIPDLIAAVNVKSTTGRSPYNKTIGLGTGHWAVRGSLIAAKSSDPAVIFGSLNYTYNFAETVQNIGKIEPGKSIGYSLGMAIALSYQTAINFSFDHSLTEKFKTAGQKVDGSFINSANVKIGANWALNEKSSIDFSVAFGVTDDAPDVTAEIRFPFVF
ncbi:MAG: transporter [Candidatus Omnitrophota bacterium]